MIISLNQESINYARIVFHTIKIFLPNLTWDQLLGKENCKNKNQIFLNIEIKEKEIIISTSTGYKITERLHLFRDNNELKRIIRLGVYKLLEEILNTKGSPWGILTGIRPTKIVHRLWDKGLQAGEIEHILKDNYYLDFEKIKKIMRTTLNQRPYILSSEEAKKRVSIYICIPFCPSKCFYCSFPSFTIKQWGNIISQYLENLHTEIKEVGKALKLKKIIAQTVYIGGGTPTVLNHNQLDKLLYVVNKHLISNQTVELTVEAGRPDTIDIQKLKVLKINNVNRISINPQTMVDRTLKKIGRKHIAQDIIEKVNLAKQIDFPVINMDLIIGLPGEKEEDLLYTLNHIKQLNPNNLTLHTLALKRASKFTKDILQNVNHVNIQRMALLAEEWCEKQKYQPYYLYRQKQMVENLENTGYCKDDFPCLYNIQMIEERQNIWGLGVGASSKIINFTDWTLTNKNNPKDLLLYQNRLKELINFKVSKILS